jgi:large subunit ribosomal protein L1
MAKTIQTPTGRCAAKLTPGKFYPIGEAFVLLKELSTVKFRNRWTWRSIWVSILVNPIRWCAAPRCCRMAPARRCGSRYSRKAPTPTLPALPAPMWSASRILAESVKAGNLDFDVVIAAPDAMRVVGQLGKILGPRGLMPNPKVGTVTPDVVGAIRNAKAGQVRYRTDKAGIIHCTIGKVDFAPNQLQENLQALLHDLQKIKPATSKGIYIRRVTVSTTMGPGLAVDQATLSF